MLLFWLMLMLLAVLIGVSVRRMTKPEMQIREDRIMTEATPVPAPEPTPPPAPLQHVWVRYDVPLDDELQQYIDDVCAQYDVPASVVMAIIGVETHGTYDPTLIGDSGNSFGLMQIYSLCHTERCVRLGAWNLLDPRQNIRVGVDYLAELLACGYGMEWALSWYNGYSGYPCDYAYAVMTEAERLLESAQLVVEE